MSAKGTKRQKLLAAKRARKAAAFTRHDGAGPNPNSKAGRRQLVRLRGEPMAPRPRPPWWSTNLVMMHPDLTRREAQLVAGQVHDFRSAR